MGQVSYMVRCLNERDGKACPGMIDIPLAGKGQCPKCGGVRTLGEHYSLRGKVHVKSPVLGLGERH